LTQRARSVPLSSATLPSESVANRRPTAQYTISRGLCPHAGTWVRKGAARMTAVSRPSTVGKPSLLGTIVRSSSPPTKTPATLGPARPPGKQALVLSHPLQEPFHSPPLLLASVQRLRVPKPRQAVDYILKCGITRWKASRSKLGLLGRKPRPAGAADVGIVG
jgi:hypothetical protein